MENKILKGFHWKIKINFEGISDDLKINSIIIDDFCKPCSVHIKTKTQSKGSLNQFLEKYVIL